MKTLKDLFLSQLADMYDAEHRIDKALAKLAKTAACAELQATLVAHLRESEGQAKKLATVFQCFDEKPKAQRCEATVGLLKESAEIVTHFKGSPAINAALIAAVQKVEHYEMATYGCLHEWAGLLGNLRAANLLQEILNQEKAANKKLNELAQACCNSEALGQTCSCVGAATADETQPSRRRKAA